MNTDYWIKAWREGRIGFHQENINPRLIEYFDLLRTSPGDALFVPLCGKSRDMLWIRDQGRRVVGIEVSATAVESFFEENELKPEITIAGETRHLMSPGIEILECDFFKLDSTDIGSVVAVYDRAALIAFPSDMRQRYADKTASLTKTGCRVLLLSIEYRGEIVGPPFSIPDGEIESLYGAAFESRLLVEEDILYKSPRFRERGAESLIERVFLLERR